MPLIDKLRVGKDQTVREVQRERYKRFAEGLSQEAVDNAVVRSFNRDWPSWHTAQLVGAYIDLNAARAINPGELGIREMTLVVSKINSPLIWQDLLREDAGLERKISVPKKTEEYARLLEARNRVTIGAAMELIHLATLYGSNIRELGNRHHYREVSTGLKKIVESIGDHFRTPARTQDEFIERLQRLFPVDSQPQSDNKAIDFFTDPKNRYVFEEWITLDQGFFDSCPLPLLQKMFLGYGKLLREEAYMLQLRTALGVNQTIWHEEEEISLSNDPHERTMTGWLNDIVVGVNTLSEDMALEMPIFHAVTHARDVQALDIKLLSSSEYMTILTKIKRLLKERGFADAHVQFTIPEEVDIGFFPEGAVVTLDLLWGRQDVGRTTKYNRVSLRVIRMPKEDEIVGLEIDAGTRGKIVAHTDNQAVIKAIESAVSHPAQVEGMQVRRMRRLFTKDIQLLQYQHI